MGKTMRRSPVALVTGERGLPGEAYRNANSFICVLCRRIWPWVLGMRALKFCAWHKEPRAGGKSVLVNFFADFCMNLLDACNARRIVWWVPGFVLIRLMLVERREP